MGRKMCPSEGMLRVDRTYTPSYGKHSFACIIKSSTRTARENRFKEMNEVQSFLPT